MKRKIRKHVTALLAAAIFFAASFPSFVFAETPNAPVVMEMQETYDELPTYYNAMGEGLVTGIKKQTGQNCWAFATMSAVETSLLKQGIVPNWETLDLSEALIDDAIYTRCDDTLHNTTGDQNFTTLKGAELSWAAQLLAGGISVADEQEYLERGKGHQFDTDFNVADFWSCAFIPTTVEDLKRAIYQYGSVSISLWSWYHGIALTGWDDEYDGLLDLDYVDNVGAFWGKDSGFVNTPEIGTYKSNYEVPYDDTEYYYEGEDMPEFWDGDRWPELFDAVAYEYRDKDTYDNVYFYDGSGFSGGIEATKAAAVFEAKAGTDTQGEQIVSATLPLASLDTTASVQIYTGLKNANDPESGTPLFESGSEPTIHADYSGMYSVDFREYGKVAPLRQGELFSVVMTLPKGGSVMTACEGTYFYSYNTENIEQGQTFFYGYQSKEGWTDGLDIAHTARLHVQTKMIPISELPPPHEHTYGTRWERNDTTHWRECSCGDKTGEAVHTKTQCHSGTQHWEVCSVCGWEGGKANHTYDNKLDTTCNICGYVRTAAPPVPPSTPSPSEPDPPDTPPDCPKDGSCFLGRFTDTNLNAWYHDGVHYCLENGLMKGYSENTFAPNDSLTRAMLAQILYSKEGKPIVSANCSFDDVASGKWYSNAVTWAAEREIVIGYGDGTFDPDGAITREQLAVMLWRYAGSPAASGTLNSFSDQGKVSGYAVDALRWAVETGILSGKGNGILDPKGKATRAEAATMLYHYFSETI